MNCPTCGANNRDEAGFCRNCGRLLLAACPRCRAAAAADANFCDTCGYPLSPRAWTGAWPTSGITSSTATPAPQPVTASAPPQTAEPAAARPLDRFIPREFLDKLTAARGAASERRVVTMLFCDIQGSTALAEQLDPEEWTEIVNAAFEQMVRPIYRYEGTVARLMGDGLLAFFGAPVAHEDDPRRAILAGLAIVDGIRAWRESLPAARTLDVRVGINTGLVVVGAVGSDLRLEYSAIGDAINLAARMEQTAAPGTVQIAEDTFRLVEGQFDVEPLGDIVVKGKQEPVRAWRVVRRAAGQRRAAPGLRAPLVNRRAEWDALERSFEGLAAGRGGVLFLTGDAGLGKTRLIDEAAQRLLPALAGARLFDGAAVSYETNQPYGLLARLMRQPLGLMAGDPAEHVRERVAAHATADDIPILETLLGATHPHATPGRPHEINGETFAHLLEATLERFWRAQAAAGPLVLALDELQWLDASSAARLAALFHLSESAPVLFLCASRRERHSHGWGLKETAGRDLPHRLIEVALHPLNDDESRLLLTELLGAARPAGGAALTQTLAAHVLEKAEGNPLFLEEVARHLIERGATAGGGWAADPAALRLPDSLLALLTARIDRLDEDPRRVLQAASVIGRRFSRAPLAALVDEPQMLDRHLVELQRMELIHEVVRLPEPGYAFNHSLTQEAVYHTILLRQRRAMHQRVAESIEARGEADAAPVLARHYLEADLPERALPHLLAAASAALRLHATTEAIDQYERALTIALTLDAPPATLRDIYTHRGRALELESRFAEAKQIYEELEQLGQARGEPSLELEALLLQGKLHANVTPLFNPPVGRALMERARPLAEQLDDRAAEVRIHWNFVNIGRFDGRFDEATTNGERGVALARELGLEEDLAFLLNDLGDAYGAAGQTERSIMMLDEAQLHWRALGNQPMLANGLTSSAIYLLISGELPAALARVDESFDLTTRIGNIWGQAYSQCVRGHILCLTGEIGSGLSDLAAGIERCRQAGFVGGELLASAYIARVLIELGDHDGALAYARSGLEVGRDVVPQFAGTCLGCIISAEIRRGDLEAAAATYEDPLLRQDERQIFNAFDVAAAGIELAMAQGRPTDAARMAGEAVERMDALAARPWLAGARLLQSEALLALGRADEATQAAVQGVKVVRQIGMRGLLWRALLIAARAAEASGDGVSAAALRDEAAAEIEFVAGQLPEALRETFMAPKTSSIC